MLEQLASYIYAIISSLFKLQTNYIYITGNMRNSTYVIWNMETYTYVIWSAEHLSERSAFPRVWYFILWWEDIFKRKKKEGSWAPGMIWKWNLPEKFLIEFYIIWSLVVFKMWNFFNWNERCWSLVVCQKWKHLRQGKNLLLENKSRSHLRRVLFNNRHHSFSFFAPEGFRVDWKLISVEMSAGRVRPF